MRGPRALSGRIGMGRAAGAREVNVGSGTLAARSSQIHRK
jgi:hypothetical protein